MSKGTRAPLLITTTAKLNKVPLTLRMDELEMAQYINTLKAPGFSLFDAALSELMFHLTLAELAFYRLQSSEAERIEIIRNIPKKRNLTYDKSRVYVVQAFDALFHRDVQYNTVSRLEFYAKAVNDHIAYLKLGARKY